MTVVFNLPPEKEAAFKAQAQARGVSLEEVADQHIPPVSISHLQKTNPHEWAKQFRAWADSRPLVSQSSPTKP